MKQQGEWAWSSEEKPWKRGGDDGESGILAWTQPKTLEMEPKRVSSCYSDTKAQKIL